MLKKDEKKTNIVGKEDWLWSNTYMVEKQHRPG